MARHIADIPRHGNYTSRLKWFLRLERRQGDGIFDSQARAPRRRNVGRKLQVFARIARQG